MPEIRATFRASADISRTPETDRAFEYDSRRLYGRFAELRLDDAQVMLVLFNPDIGNRGCRSSGYFAVATRRVVDFKFRALNWQ